MHSAAYCLAQEQKCCWTVKMLNILQYVPSLNYPFNLGIWTGPFPHLWDQVLDFTKKIVEAFLKKFWFELKLKTLIQNVQKVNIWALISHQSQIEYFHPLNSGLHSEMLLHRSSEKANWPLSQNPTRQTKSRALILFSTPGFYVTTHITEISKRNWPFWSMHLLHSLQ